MALGFIDPKKAYNTLPRDMAMTTLRMGGCPRGGGEDGRRHI